MSRADSNAIGLVMLADSIHAFAPLLMMLLLKAEGCSYHGGGDINTHLRCIVENPFTDLFQVSPH